MLKIQPAAPATLPAKHLIALSAPPPGPVLNTQASNGIDPAALPTLALSLRDPYGTMVIGGNFMIRWLPRRPRTYRRPRRPPRLPPGKAPRFHP
jgi:hypothetical protein